LVLFNYCAITCLKNKNKRWKYVYICSSFFFLLSNVSGEISPTPGLERNLR
jgi:hypothetical protein